MGVETAPIQQIEQHKSNYYHGILAIDRFIDAYGGETGTFTYGRRADVQARSAQIGLDASRLIGTDTDKNRYHYTHAVATSFSKLRAGTLHIDAVVSIFPSEVSYLENPQAPHINLIYFRKGKEDPWVAAGNFNRPKDVDDIVNPQIVVPQIQLASFGDVARMMRGDERAHYKEIPTGDSMKILRTLSARRTEPGILV